VRQQLQTVGVDLDFASSTVAVAITAIMMVEVAAVMATGRATFQVAESLLPYKVRSEELSMKTT
jgi:hypothetical protein